MHRRFAAMTVLAIAIAPPAGAEQTIAEPQPVRIVITKVDCSRLVRHAPSADVAYKPGEGIGGRTVVPADLPGSGAQAMGSILPDVLEFPITINPVAYGARNQAYRSKAAAEQGQANTYAAKTAAQNALAKLSSEKATLDAQATTLDGQRTALIQSRDTLATQLATMKSEIESGTRSRSDIAYMRKADEVAAANGALAAKQKDVDANQAKRTANASASAAQQAIVAGAPAKDARYVADKSAAEAKLDAISARGLDSTTMPVGMVRYDMAKGIFTFNGEPIGSAEQQELAQACARQGVR